MQLRKEYNEFTLVSLLYRGKGLILQAASTVKIKLNVKVETQTERCDIVSRKLVKKKMNVTPVKWNFVLVCSECVTVVLVQQ